MFKLVISSSDLGVSYSKHCVDANLARSVKYSCVFVAKLQCAFSLMAKYKANKVPIIATITVSEWSETN